MREAAVTHTSPFAFLFRFCPTIQLLCSLSKVHTYPLGTLVRSRRSSQDLNWLRRFVSLYTAFHSSTKTFRFGYSFSVTVIAPIRNRYDFGVIYPHWHRLKKFHHFVSVPTNEIS